MNCLGSGRQVDVLIEQEGDGLSKMMELQVLAFIVFAGVHFLSAVDDEFEDG